MQRAANVSATCTGGNTLNILAGPGNRAATSAQHACAPGLVRESDRRVLRASEHAAKAPSSGPPVAQSPAHLQDVLETAVQRADPEPGLADKQDDAHNEKDATAERREEGRLHRTHAEPGESDEDHHQHEQARGRVEGQEGAVRVAGAAGMGCSAAADSSREWMY